MYIQENYGLKINLNFYEAIKQANEFFSGVVASSFTVFYSFLLIISFIFLFVLKHIYRQHIVAVGDCMC